jgi:hypothetical protein
MESFSRYVKLNSKIPPEVLNALSGIEEPARLADTMAAHMSLKVAEKQELLEMADIVLRLEKLLRTTEASADIGDIIFSLLSSTFAFSFASFDMPALAIFCSSSSVSLRNRGASSAGRYHGCAYEPESS